MSTLPLPIFGPDLCKFSYFTNSKLTLGVKFIFIISLMHTLSDKVRFVQGKLNPEEEFTTKKWMVHTEHLLAQAHIYLRIFLLNQYYSRKPSERPLRDFDHFFLKLAFNFQ